MENDIKQILKLLLEMRTKQDKMEEDISGMKQDIEGLKSQVSENTAVLDALEHRAAENSARIENLSITMIKEFGAVRAETAEVKADVAEVKVELTEVKNDVSSIKADTKGIPTIKEMVLEHEFNFRQMKIS